MKKIILSLLLATMFISPLAAAKTNWTKKNLPVKLVTSSSKTINTNSALKDKMIALYFTASWCPPCRAFTPLLVDFYNKTAKQGNLEIILVSSDRDKKSMMKYMEDYKMPWPAIPFQSKFAAKLKSKFGVRGIPALIILDSNGNILSNNGRMDVVKHKENAIKMWQEKAM